MSRPPRPRRVGHKGADHIAPGNTPASFDAAVAHGVDMIEFDVLSERPDGTGELYLAHDYGALRAGAAPTLEEGLAHLAQDAFAGVELDVDLKLQGYELRVLDALRRHGLLERALVSTMEIPSLARLRAAEPSLRLGWSVPRLRRDPMRSPWTRVPAIGWGLAYRTALPRRAAAAIRAGRADALMAQWRLVTAALVRRVHAAGGELYVWTVDDAATIARLEALGVDGVISNDPRLFDA
ncbi:MAG: glycerophosphodiester phosphodiesterase [Solirubrobacteraceae bacterium]|nr:glycerophosphodiester phosphodiesterase [Solirubrobacteraceae bacterium]